MGEPADVYSWFARSAERWGDEHDALEVAGQRLGYLQLRQRAERLAARLHAALDGRAPRRVGLLAARSLGAYSGYLGILRADAAVVPLSPEYPASRLRAAVEAAELDLVLADAEHADVELGIPVVSTRDIDTDAGPPPPPRARPDDLAYVIFTSGSTGVPKGVPITHRNLCSYLEQISGRYDIGPGSRVSGNFELTFDGSVHDLFVTWSQGGTLVVPQRHQLLSPVRTVNSLRLTHWFSVPSLIAFAMRLDSLTPGSMPSLRWSVFGGEAVLLDAVRQWRSAAPDSRVEVLYGPTELTIACTAFRMPDDPADWPSTPDGVAPIGECLPHLEHRLLDADGAEAEVGELCVRGPQRFRGYLDAAEDAAAFAPDQHGGESWYRTGDRVARRDDTLIYLGRSDHQVKIHGHRIEPGEIEAALRQLPGVEEATVVAVPADDGEVALTAAVSGAGCVPEKLHATLSNRLPSYMLPRRITVLDRLPLNGNGKVDRRALITRLGHGD